MFIACFVYCIVDSDDDTSSDVQTCSPYHKCYSKYILLYILREAEKKEYIL